MKTTGWLVTLAAVAALVVLIEESRMAGLREQLAAAEEKNATLVATAPAGLLDPPAEKSKRMLATRTEREPKAVDDDEPAEDADDSDDASLGQSLRKMADSAAGRAMMNQGVRAMAGMWFDKLIGEFDLNAEEKGYFLDLIASGMGEQQQIAMKMMSAATDEDRKKLRDEIKEAENKAKASIKEFLNDEDDYKRYDEYTERLSEYQQLEGLRAVMNQAESPLSPEQEDQVVEAMYQARTGQQGRSDWEGAEGMELMASGNAVSRFEEEWDRSAEHTANEVDRVLDDGQMEAFRSYQEQMRDVQLMGIRMAEKMFKNSETGSGGEAPDPGAGPDGGQPPTPTPVPDGGQDSAGREDGSP